MGRAVLTARGDFSPRKRVLHREKKKQPEWTISFPAALRQAQRTAELARTELAVIPDEGKNLIFMNPSFSPG